MAKDIIYQVCPQCKGEGKIIEGSIDDNGQEVFIETTCPMCKGKKELVWGRIVKE